MAFWDKISSRGQVEDRRAAGPIAVGGLSLGGLAVLLLLNYLGGGDVGDVLSQLENVQVPVQEQQNAGQFSGEDSYEVFASTVLGSNNDMWKKVFAQNNLSYTEPKLVLFRTATQSGCGVATSDVGPHYCPSDNTVYLDETFFEELEKRFGAGSADVAQAYVISHEVGHHAQNQLGLFDEAGRDNDTSIKLELQADCFAGLWANSIKPLNVFEQGEIHEAMDAAAAVGDDRIQTATEGQVSPENWTHGSSEQRVSWFDRGYNSGSISSCNTFE